MAPVLFDEDKIAPEVVEVEGYGYCLAVEDKLGNKIPVWRTGNRTYAEAVAVFLQNLREHNAPTLRQYVQLLAEQSPILPEQLGIEGRALIPQLRKTLVTEEYVTIASYKKVQPDDN